MIDPREMSRAALDEGRHALAEARRTSSRLAREATAGQAALARLRRTHRAADDRVVAAEQEQEQLLSELSTARAAVAEAQRGLAARLEGFLPRDASDDVARLDAAFPIVLFPVRLETRFDAAADPPQLRIRLYPDTIHMEAHDPRLTEVERDAGFAYWRRGWTDEPAAWRDLLRQFPAPRAAWIVRATEPVNLDARPQGRPVLPEVELRAESWDRAPEAGLLPDRWIVLAFRSGEEIHRAVSLPVRDPLAVGFDPHVPPEEGVEVMGDELRLDPELAWTVDFTRAEEVGMALRIPLEANDLQLGFDLLLALGVKGSLTPEETRARFEHLLAGHHHAGGLAFVRQGTPTNNMEDASSGYPPPDPDGTRSFTVERREPLDVERGDGARTMRALGLGREVVAHVERADGMEQAVARAMNQALWPATWGYFLRHMMAPHVSDVAIGQAREHFVEYVRGRGPLPAFRVRAQPYGLIPVTSLSLWEPRDQMTGLERELPMLLQRLRPHWRLRIADVPRVGRTADPDADLLAALGMDASTRQVRVRRVHGPDFRLNLLRFLGLDTAEWEATQGAIAEPAMALIGQPTWRPRILRMDFADEVGRFGRALVAPVPLSEETGLESALGFDYVQWIREASLSDLRNERLPDGQQRPTALLYLMLRHARLTELARVAVDLHVDHGSAPPVERHERELLGIPGTRDERPTIWQRLAEPIPAVSGAAAIGEFLAGRPDVPEATPLHEHDAALETLMGLPTAELQRIFTETLDLCAHRLDAWVTSLATRRLEVMRAANPTGTHVGAFAWVEDLRPALPGSFREATLADGRVARIPSGSGGYVQAPSMSHAAAAAVLRNAHLTRGEAYATDLSSARVRTASSLLDAVRDGQPLGAVLGYQVERGLHEDHRPLVLDRFIEPLRLQFPLVANKAGVAPGPPAVAAARNVMDGLALHTARKAGELDLADPEFLPDAPPTAAERAALEVELSRLDETVDAVADLLTAESVFQIVNGNAGGANASLDAMAKGSRPPDPAVVRQPRGGVALTHRVALVLGGGATAPESWDAVATPRALAEPSIDAWAGRLLGDPGAVRCRVELSLAAAESTEAVVTLRQLDLRPIDILALAQDDALDELEARVAEAALMAAPPGTQVTALRFERDPAWDRDAIRTFPEVLEVARAADQLLAAARPLGRADLAPREATPSLSGTDPLAEEARQRALTARHTLAELAAALDAAVQAAALDSVREHLRTVSLYGITGAFPAADQGLLEQASAARSEIERRRAAAAGTDEPGAVARAVFGRAFLLLTPFQPPQADELRQALEAGPELVGEPRAARAWLHQAARTRRALRPWRRLALLGGSLGVESGTLDVVQLPHMPGARWAALPFVDGVAPPRGLVSIVLHRLVSPDPAGAWLGLLVDEWNETIPDGSPLTSVAFHHDAPGVEPPQAVLIAVPPRGRNVWDLDSLVGAVEETLEAAKLRAVDGELLGVLGQLAPVVYLAGNVADDTVSTDLRPALVADEHLDAERT